MTNFCKSVMYRYVFNFIIFIENFFDDFNILIKSELTILLTIVGAHHEAWKCCTYATWVVN